MDLGAVLVLLLREPGQQLLSAGGRLGVDEAQRDRSAELRVLGPVVLDEEVVISELLAVEAVTEKTVLLYGDADATVARVDDVRAPEDDTLARNTSRQERLIASLEVSTGC